VLEYTSLRDSTPKRHAATVPGIKLSHLVCMHVCMYVIPLFQLHDKLSDFLRNLIHTLCHWGKLKSTANAVIFNFIHSVKKGDGGTNL